MIKIVISYCNSNETNRVQTLRVSGHADSGPYGHDLVCAAISAILIGGANALLQGYESNPNFLVKLNKGNAIIDHMENKSYSDEQRIILDTIVTMLKTVQESNPKFVKIEENNK